MDSSVDPPAPDPRPHSGLRRFYAVAMVADFGALGVSAAFVTSRDRPAGSAPKSASSPAFRPPENKAGYLGPQACAECHRDRVREFSETRHFMACLQPDPALMPVGFEEGNNVYRSADPPVRFEMTKREGDYFQAAMADTAGGEYKAESKIGFVYGAGGTTDEVYLAWQGNRLYELPVAWLHGVEEWGAVKLNPSAGGTFARELLPRCLECHTTWFRHTPGTLNEYDPESFILGVTCERCHGPGRDHVAYHKAHAGRPAEAIVRPATLSRDRQTDLCGQCHGNTIRSKTAPFEYRPGEPLDDYFHTLRTHHPEDDHVANQVGHMVQSLCFTRSDSLTCTTCHDPHRPLSGPGLAVVRQACAQCHEPSDCTDRDDLPAEVRDDCTGCHMPRRNKVQVNFRTENDAYVAPAPRYEHRIAVYPEARSEVLWNWRHARDGSEDRREAERLADELASHWRDEADRLRADHRYLAAIDAYRGSLRFRADDATRARLDEVVAIHTRLDRDWFLAVARIDSHRYAEARETLQGILALKPDWADAYGRLGLVEAILGDREPAVEHLTAVQQIDPDNPYGLTMLAWLAFLDGRFQDSLDLYRRADEIDPRNEKVCHQIGTCLLRLGRHREAREQFRVLLEIDPNLAAGYQGLAQAIRGEGNAAEAIPHARRAVELTNSRDIDMLMTLAEVYADAGRLRDAARSFETAARVAEWNSPQSLPHIRSQANELRSRMNDGGK